MSKHESFKHAYNFGSGVEAEIDRSKFLKDYAQALQQPYEAIRGEYDEWAESYADSIHECKPPRLEECAAARDFFSARLALALQGSKPAVGYYTVEQIDQAEAAAGVQHDSEDQRRAIDIARQARHWMELGETMVGGCEVTQRPDGALMAAKYGRKGPGQPSLVAKHFLLRGRAQNYDGEQWHYVIEYRDHTRAWKTRLVPASQLGSKNDEWVNEVRDAGAAIIDAKLLGSLMMATVIGTVRLASAPGWQDKGFTVYTTPGGQTIGAAEVTVKTFTSRSGYETSGTKGEADEHIFNKAVGNSRMIGTCTAVLAGPFLGPLNVHPGMVHFYGASGTGKTVVQRVGLAIQASGRKMLSWNTTENGFEGLALNHNGGSLCIEELKQGASPKVAYKAIMALGNGTGKQAMSRDRKLKEAAEFSVFAVSSGESDVRSFISNAGVSGVTYDGGIASRAADIPSDAGAQKGCFENLHGEATPYDFAKKLEIATSKFYGHHLLAMLEAYLKSPESSAEEIRRTMVSTLEEIGIAGDENVTRPIERFALMAAVGEFAVAHGVLNWPVGEAKRGILQLVADWRTARQGDNNLPSGSTEALEGVSKLESALAMLGSRFQRGGLDVPNRLGFIPDADGGDEILYLSKAQLAEIVGSERLLPLVKYISDGKHPRFGLRTYQKRKQTTSPPGEIANALGAWCYAIVLKKEVTDP